MKTGLTGRLFTGILTAVIFILGLYAVAGVVPLGPDTFTNNGDRTLSIGNFPAKTHDAYAGNITNIDIDTRAQTKHWQGYFGDISGTIVLDDANNYTLYDWPNAEPKGEIYATANSTTVDWATAECFNFTDGAGAGLGNLTEWEVFYNMTYNDVDGIDETFNMTSHPDFDIGDVASIQANTCPSTYMHMNDTFQENKWSEVLLQDSGGRLIFTAIIENDDTGNNTDVQGYIGTPETPDFQMIVGEDGTGRVGAQINTATTTYYFYVDLQ